MAWRSQRPTRSFGTRIEAKRGDSLSGVPSDRWGVKWAGREGDEPRLRDAGKKPREGEGAGRGQGTRDFRARFSLRNLELSREIRWSTVLS